MEKIELLTNIVTEENDSSDSSEIIIKPKKTKGKTYSVTYNYERVRRYFKLNERGTGGNSTNARRQGYSTG